MDTHPLPIFSSNLEELRGPSFSTLGGATAPLPPLPAPLGMTCVLHRVVFPCFVLCFTSDPVLCFRYRGVFSRIVLCFTPHVEFFMSCVVFCTRIVFCTYGPP